MNIWQCCSMHAKPVVGSVRPTDIFYHRAASTNREWHHNRRAHHHTLITATRGADSFINWSESSAIKTQLSHRPSMFGVFLLMCGRLTENMMHLDEAGRDVTALSDTLLWQFLNAGKKVVLPKEFHSGTPGLRCLRFQGCWHAVLISTEGRATTTVLHLMQILDKTEPDTLRGNKTLQRFDSGVFDCCCCTFKMHKGDFLPLQLPSI